MLIVSKHSPHYSRIKCNDIDSMWQEVKNYQGCIKFIENDNTYISNVTNLQFFSNKCYFFKNVQYIKKKNPDFFFKEKS